MPNYKIIDSVEDQMRDVVTVEDVRSDGSRGTRICLAGSAVRAYGLVGCLKRAGFEVPTERQTVKQYGQSIGTVPGSFEPMDIRSTSFWYEPRDGDFKWDGSAWIAADSLGPGDFEAVPGFVWDRDRDTRRMAETEGLGVEDRVARAARHRTILMIAHQTAEERDGRPD
jgi:hypothetical protein